MPRCSPSSWPPKKRKCATNDPILRHVMDAVRMRVAEGGDPLDDRASPASLSEGKRKDEAREVALGRRHAVDLEALVVSALHLPRRTISIQLALAALIAMAPDPARAAGKTHRLALQVSDDLVDEDQPPQRRGQCQPALSPWRGRDRDRGLQRRRHVARRHLAGEGAAGVVRPGYAQCRLQRVRQHHPVDEKQREGKDIPIVPQAKIVPAGVVTLIELAEHRAGSSYGLTSMPRGPRRRGYGRGMRVIALGTGGRSAPERGAHRGGRRWGVPRVRHRPRHRAELRAQAARVRRRGRSVHHASPLRPCSASSPTS